MVDYHRILGVSRDASSEDIKAAFRRQALKFHPDHHTNASKSEQSRAAENFRQVKEAYEALSNDPSKVRSGSQYSSTSGSTWSNSSYTSARAGRSNANDRGYRQWYQERGSSGVGGENFRAEWSYRTNESFYGRGDGTRYYQRTVRWHPSQGPGIVLRAAFFGFAAITFIIMNSIFKPQSVEFRKSYDEMYERVQQEKRFRENKNSEEPQPQPQEWDSGWGEDS